MKFQRSAQKMQIFSHRITSSGFALQNPPIAMTLQVVEA
jgi:hypothetical protein